jgi:hypothetical protein
LGDAQAEITDLKQKLEDREALKSIAESLEFADDVYWKRKKDQTLDGPYCPTCWDDSRKLVHLKFGSEGEFAGKGVVRRYECVLHKTQYFFRREMFGPGRVIR